MEIQRFNIPKLPRNKYKSVSIISANMGGSSTIINNISGGGGSSSVNVYDDVDSMATDVALSANQGRILNEKITADEKNIEANTKLSKENKENIAKGSKNNDLINVTYLSSGQCFYNVGDAASWLVNNKDIKKYDVHYGMSLKYRDYMSGKWLTYLYVGSSTDWKDSNYSNADNWVLHAREKEIDVINNLTSDSTTDALAAKQGKVINGKITHLQDEIDNLDNKFLSKVHADTANGLITFDKGLISNGNVSIGGYATDPNVGTGIYNDIDNNNAIVETDNVIARKDISSNNIYIDNSIQSNNYTNDTTGFSIYKDTTGKYTLDIDNANVRGRLDVQTLQIEEAKYIGGKLFCTYAGMTCSSVKSVAGNYRCYFKQNDSGKEIHNQFEVGDLAYCQTFNNNKLRRWWREVESVGTDYIDVSISVCEPNSDIPIAGDEIVQLGNLQGNTERQNALILEPLKMNIFTGINSFRLPEPKISLNPTLSTIKGKFVNEATNEDITTTFANLGDKIDAESKRVITDKDGKITNINKSGLVLTDDFNSLYSEAVNKDTNVVKKAEISTFVDEETLDAKIKAEADKISYDINGNITNIDKSGLVLTDEFSSLYTEAVNGDNNVVKKAEISTFVDKDTMDAAIKAEADKITYDEFGNVTNINKSGLVTTGDFSALFNQNLNSNDEIVTKSILSACNYVTDGEVNSKIEAEASKISYDDAGNITNIDKSGLVLENDFNSLYTAAVDGDDNVVKKAEISTFITEDDANNIVSNATIEADKINFNGKTIINNNFKVDEQGNLDINGKITTKSGKIGNFNITQKGLYNDASEDGEAELFITNSVLGGTPQYLFAVKNASDAAYTTIQARGGTVLDCSTENGIAANLESWSNIGWSLKTNNRCQLTGVYLHVKALTDESIMHNGRCKVNEIDDFITCNFTKSVIIDVPTPTSFTEVGKIYRFKNISTSVVLNCGRIINKDSVDYASSMLLNKGQSLTIITDGLSWYIM